MRMTMTVPVAAALFICGGALADAEFESPQRITAGGDNFSSVLYPSPVLFDVDGDGNRDLVIGDLRGYLMACAPGADANDDLAWSAMKNLESEGNPLKLHNW